MTDTPITSAFAALKARAVEQVTGMPLYWQDEDNALPDAPAAFCYLELVTDRGSFIEIGGGRGANTWRTPGELRAYVFLPRGEGLASGLVRAEAVAAAFRSYRGGGVTCDGASVHPVGEGEALAPPGLASAADAYACVMVAIPLHFDQVG